MDIKSKVYRKSHDLTIPYMKNPVYNDFDAIYKSNDELRHYIYYRDKFWNLVEKYFIFNNHKDSIFILMIKFIANLSETGIDRSIRMKKKKIKTMNDITIHYAHRPFRFRAKYYNEEFNIKNVSRK